MPSLPLARSAAASLHARAAFAAERNFGAVELVETDVVAAFKQLLRDGSPMLRHELIAAALEYATPQ